MREFLVCFIIFGIFSCEIDKRPKEQNSNQTEAKSIFGLYSYYLALPENGDCETVKRSLKLNTDSTFVMKEYCLDNYMSSFKPSIKTGVFISENETVLNLTCFDKTQFRIKLVNDSTLEITPSVDLTYPYQRDTTKNEDL